ncbi:hypothetical protein CLM62_11150 [Streptomyces sp. SA15]|nr:hypothetical protein CLM62_11150 [Streptomyces sp. SA15]
MAVPTTVMFAIGLWGLDRGGIWGDESVTFAVGRRTVPQIWQLLHEMDAVHGLYYLFMHAVLAVHPGEVVLRLPSVCAAAATAGLVAALGVRLARPRVGLWAGLLYAVTPMTGHYAQEGRSYALVAAGAAGATLLLVRAVDERSDRPGRPWWPYAGVVAVTCLLHELAVLVLCAHATTLALARVPSRVWFGWGRAAGAAGVVLLPLVWASQRQAGQVAWLVAPGWERVEGLARSAAVGPTGVVFWASVLLAAVGLGPGSEVASSARQAPPPTQAPGAGRVAVVALPLLVVPPGILMAVSQFQPLYHDRYVLYALAGAPLLVAAGADRVAGAVGHLRLGGHRLSCGRPVVLTGVLAIALAFLHCLPLHRHDRSPAHRPENLAAVSALAAHRIRPGEPVLFLPSAWRLTALAYPNGFRGARDVALRDSGPRSGTLSGRETTPRELRHSLVSADRVWVVAQSDLLRSRRPPDDPTERAKLAVLAGRFIPREEYVHGRVTLRLYVRRPPTSRPPTSSPPTSRPPASPPPTSRPLASPPTSQTGRTRPVRW